jgi:hypothetical protein
MIFLRRLTNNASVHPITKGMLAIKPQRRDSNIVWDGIADAHISYKDIICY